MNYKVVIAALLFLPCLLVGAEAPPSQSPSQAQSQPQTVRNFEAQVDCTQRPVEGEALVGMMGFKFVRGLTNIITGVGEIPRQIIISSRYDDSALSVPTGFFTGIFMTVARITYGGVEVITFLFPLEGTYDSLLAPQFVWGPIENKICTFGQPKEQGK